MNFDYILISLFLFFSIFCRFGGLEGATFCTLSTLFKQFESEGYVDVYMYSKLYHEQRPGVWKSPVSRKLI